MQGFTSCTVLDLVAATRTVGDQQRICICTARG